MGMGVLASIIAEDSYLFEEDVSDSEFNGHHVVPLAVTKEVELGRRKGRGRKRRENKNNKKLPGKVERLFAKFYMMKLNFKKKVLIRSHDNYNCVIGGDLLPTEALGKLRYEILRIDYRVCSKGKKKEITRFFSHAAKFNNIEYNYKEIETIDEKLERKCVFPANILKMFKMTRKDIEYYMEKNFLYPRYDEFYEVWNFLSENYHKNNKQAMRYHRMFIENNI